ncbi:MAG: hypothetical protein JW827_12870 [Spirochaetes bacterium]|nr:hypothetical protein [Spirochaetota bacterium]
MNPISLGIEFSTQSVKLIGFDVTRKEVIFKDKFEYDNLFPSYHTSGGVLPCKDEKVKHTSPSMLIESLDLAFTRLLENKIPVKDIKAIKLDAMQHCTVYLDSEFSSILSGLSVTKTLLEQIRPALTRNSIPIWEDRSTLDQVSILDRITSGKVARITGNAAEMRFPAAQILKWAVQDPEAYKNTSHIFLLSAFLTSILIGRPAPVDTGDGWGSNLNALDIDHPSWNSEVLKAIDEYLGHKGIRSNLAQKIGAMAHYDEVLGRISSYFSEKYGLDDECVVLTGTGDNPATLLGCGGGKVISLGSSFTVNGIMNRIIPSKKREYNIFGYTRGKVMALSCFTNGTKLHDHFKQKYCGVHGKWDEYRNMAGNIELEKNERLMLPYLMDESVPVAKKGIVRDGFDEKDGSINIRSLHISQVLSLKLHCRHLESKGSLCIVGGGSKNPFLRQMITDIFKTNSYTIKHPDLAAVFGCAISGARFLLDISYEKATEQFIHIDASSILKPSGQNQKVIPALLERYQRLELRNHR